MTCRTHRAQNLGIRHRRSPNTPRGGSWLSRKTICHSLHILSMVGYLKYTNGNIYLFLPTHHRRHTLPPPLFAKKKKIFFYIYINKKIFFLSYGWRGSAVDIRKADIGEKIYAKVVIFLASIAIFLYLCTHYWYAYIEALHTRV